MKARSNHSLLCWQVERDLALYLSEDLSPEESAAVTQHLFGCEACTTAVASARRLLSLLEERPVEAPPPVLLAACRDNLQESLDTVRPTGYSRWKWFLQAINPSGWIIAHPAWSAAVLIVLGVSLGYAAPAWYNGWNQVAEAQPFVTVRPGVDLRDVGAMNVAWQPAAGQQPGNVVIQLTTETPFVLSGSPDDPEVRNILVFALRNAERFDLDVRLGSVEALRTRLDDAEIREAVVYAARNDFNPGIRLKAVEALRGHEQDERVRNALLDALVHDPNLGVRGEAVAALRALTESGSGVPFGDERIVTVLRDRMKRDPNTHIRIQSAAAVRQIEPRQTH